MGFPTAADASPNRTVPTPRPVNLPELAGLDIKSRYLEDRCSGDFFDAVLTGARVLFLLTDIAGSREETHPIAAQVQEVFRAKARELFEPPDANESEGIALLAHAVNRALMDAAHGVRFSPTFVGCFNLPVGVLTYHNAGAMTAIFRDAEGTRILGSGGIPMGLFTHSTYEPAFLAFDAGAQLLIVTKGVTEIRHGATTFGIDRVQRALENSGTESALQICEDVLREAHDSDNHPWSRVYGFLHPGKRQCRDDMTAVALVRKPI